jgi:hypothetical protein
LVAITVPFIAWLLNNRTSSKVKLDWSVRHSFTFILQEPSFDDNNQKISDTKTVNTASISLVNSGRAVATKVEVVFNWKPQHINIWPIRHYEEKISNNGRVSICLENLAPKEVFGFEILSVNSKLPEIVNVRSEQVSGKYVTLAPQVVLANWKVRMIFTLFLIGIGTVVYMLAVFIQLIAYSKPLGLI